MSEASRIDDIVYLARNTEDYLQHLDGAVREQGERRQRRIEYASQFSFDNMLNLISGPISALATPRSQ
jgi:hypothetical protein